MNADVVQAFKKWRKDPILFAKQVLNVELDEWQKEALLSFRDNPRTAMLACTGPGKSFLLAVAAFWFLTCFATKESKPKAIVLSITSDNLRSGLWSELGSLYGKSEILQAIFDKNENGIFNRQYKDDWFLKPRSFKDSADDEKKGAALSGIHSDFLAYFLDEVGTMPLVIGKKAMQGLSKHDKKGVFQRILMAGNPDTTSGLLYYAAQNPDKWNIINITSDPLDPKRTPRVSLEVAQEAIDEFGRDNPWVQSTILGKFPTESINNLFTSNMLQDSYRRDYFDQDFNWAEPRMGIDLADEGMDSNIIFPRQGLMAGWKYKNINTSKQSVKVSTIINSINKFTQTRKLEMAPVPFLDGTGGYASAVCDGLETARIPHHKIHFGEKADDRGFENKRAEMYFRASEWMKKGGKIYKCDKLAKQLLAVTYSHTPKGRFIIEPKKKLVQKLNNKSPDEMDAFVLTFAHPERSIVRLNQGKNVRVSKLDDFDQGKRF